MGMMNVNQIKNYLPHRYPFLLVDRVTEFETGKYLKAIKNVTVNEPFFNGHFPNQPIMPGVLIIEALAQATGLLGFRTMGEEPQKDTLYMLVAVDKARFKQAVVPGVLRAARGGLCGKNGRSAERVEVHVFSVLLCF